MLLRSSAAGMGMRKTGNRAQLMERLGYDVLWTAEHHFQREGYECLPNLVQLGLWLATDWPLGLLGSGYLLSVHTTLYLIYTMVAAPAPTAPPSGAGSSTKR